MLWLKVSLPHHTKYICCLYRSPNDNNHSLLFDHLTYCIESFQLASPSSEIIILGDLNVHNSNWLSHSRHTDRAGAEAEEFSILNDLSQLVNTPTRIPDRVTDFANTLDLFLTSKPDLYFPVSTYAPLGSSDHCLITINHPFTPFHSPAPPKRTLWKFATADWDGLRDFFAEFPWKEVCFSSDISSTATSITDIILTGMSTYISHSAKSSSHSSPSWFNHQCTEAIRRKNVSFRNWKASPTSDARAAYTEARNSCTNIIDEAKNNFVRGMADKVASCPSGSRSFWGMAKSISSNFCESRFPPLINNDGSISSNPFSKADTFAKTFSSNSTLDDTGHSPLSFPNLPYIMPDIKISSRLVRQTLQKLDIKKATGPDGVPPIVLRRCAPELAPVLSKLFRLSYTLGSYPSSWKHAHIFPVPKKGDKSNPSNYRPIAITSILSKTMETIINKQLLSFLESSKLLSDHQYGFRHGRSTGDLLAYVTNLWSSALDSFGESRVIALDISKAFDKVWHKGLLAKLPSYGFSPNLILWTENFLTDRSISVRVDGALSKKFPINSGVPQGSVISPTLFLLFINDLLSSTTNPIHSFADDSTLHQSVIFNSQKSSSHSINASRTSSAISLNRDLQAILKWGSDNLVKFNDSKTQNLIISYKNTANLPPVTMDGDNLAQASAINILGMEISSKLSWKSHILNVAKRASQKLGFLFRARHYFNSSQLMTLYKAQVRPSMEYCCHIWGGAPASVLHILDRIQNKAIRLINEESLTTSLQSLSHRRTVSSLCLFYRYFNRLCSDELAATVPPPYHYGRTTRLSSSSHPFCVSLHRHRCDSVANSFFPRTARIWNKLPSTVFPPLCDPHKFKLHINKLDLSLYV